MTKPVIRIAGKSDIPQVISLMNQLFEMEEGVTINEHHQEAGLQLLIDHPHAAVIVAKQNDQVIGMCTIQSMISTAEGGLTGWIEDMVVDQTIRAGGIGAQVLKYAEQWGKEQGFTRIQLMCDENNTPGKSFYKKYHWEKTTWTCWGKKEF